MILIDECVDKSLAKYLITHGLPEVISIEGKNPLIETDDKFIAELCDYYHGLLITSDAAFFKEYKGNKLYIKPLNSNHNELPKELVFKTGDHERILQKIKSMNILTYNKLIIKGLIKQITP